jgi:hypothetical protein
MPIARYKRTRFWAVWDAAGQLICVCVYRKGAEEVARRLALLPPLASDSCWQCKAELPALADAASPCPLCGAELLLL